MNKACTVPRRFKAGLGAESSSLLPLHTYFRLYWSERKDSSMQFCIAYTVQVVEQSHPTLFNAEPLLYTKYPFSKLHKARYLTKINLSKS